MMMVYRQLTGGGDIAGFWKTSPSELGAWAQAINAQSMAHDWQDVPEEGEAED